jgi:hypothetical protein
MTGLHPVQHLNGTLVKHPHRQQPPATRHPPQTPTATPASSRARQRDQRVIDRLIDRLGTQPPTPIKKALTQLVGDLLRTPPLGQQLGNGLGQHTIANDSTRSGLARADTGRMLSAVGRKFPPLGVKES